MKTLLITGIGSDIAQGVAKIVRSVRPEWRIVGVDIHNRHGGQLFADVVETVPRASDKTYYVKMADVAVRHNADFCLPISEAELSVIVQDALVSFGPARLIGIADSAVKIGLDKWLTMQFIRQQNIPVPWTLEGTDGVAIQSFPCIFKPRRSAGSKGIHICADMDDVRWCLSKEKNGIFQELLIPADREVTCAVYRNNQGETAVLPMLRQLVGGFTGWASVIDDPTVIEQCRAIAKAIDLRGAINIQMRITHDGPRIFEINPRFSSTVFMRHLLGFTDLEWMLDELEGKKTRYQFIPVGTCAVRVQGAEILVS